jgi:hypothetical protein
MFFFSSHKPIGINEKEEKKKTIVITDKIMYAKAKEKKDFCLDYYLFSCNNSKREKKKSIFSLFFYSLSSPVFFT